MTNIFKEKDVADLVGRINNLTPETTPLWGKMSVSQMLAHVNVSYELVYDNKHKTPSPLMKWILKTFIKEAETGWWLGRYDKDTKPFERSIRKESH